MLIRRPHEQKQPRSNERKANGHNRRRAQATTEIPPQLQQSRLELPEMHIRTHKYGLLKQQPKQHGQRGRRFYALEFDTRVRTRINRVYDLVYRVQSCLLHVQVRVVQEGQKTRQNGLTVQQAQEYRVIACI